MGAGLRHRTEPASIRVGAHHAESRNVGHRCRQVELDSGILNDNNYPFSAGRTVGAPDNKEFILTRLDSSLPFEGRGRDDRGGDSHGGDHPH